MMNAHPEALRAELNSCVRQRETIRLLIVAAEERVVRMELKAHQLVMGGARMVFPDVEDAPSEPLLSRIHKYEGMVARAAFLRGKSTELSSTHSPSHPISSPEGLTSEDTRGLECAAWAVGVDEALVLRLRDAKRRFGRSASRYASREPAEPTSLRLLERETSSHPFNPKTSPPISEEDVRNAFKRVLPYSDVVQVFPPSFLVGCPDGLLVQHTRPRSDYKLPHVQGADTGCSQRFLLYHDAINPSCALPNPTSLSTRVDPHNEYAVALAIAARYRECLSELLSLVAIDAHEYNKLVALEELMESHRKQTTCDVGVQVQTVAPVRLLRQPKPPLRKPLWLRYIEPTNPDLAVLHERLSVAHPEAAPLMDADDELLQRLEAALCANVDRAVRRRAELASQVAELGDAMDTAAEEHALLVRKVRELMTELAELKANPPAVSSATPVHSEDLPIVSLRSSPQKGVQMPPRSSSVVELGQAFKGYPAPPRPIPRTVTVGEPAPPPTEGEPTPSLIVGEPAPLPTEGEPAPSLIVGEPAPPPTEGEPTPLPSEGEPAPSLIVDEPAPLPTEGEPATSLTVGEPASPPTEDEPPAPPHS